VWRHPNKGGRGGLRPCQARRRRSLDGMLTALSMPHGRSNHQHATGRSPGGRSKSMGWARSSACSVGGTDEADHRSPLAAQDLSWPAVSVALRQNRTADGLHCRCSLRRGNIGEACASRGKVVARECRSCDRAGEALPFRRGRLSGSVVSKAQWPEARHELHELIEVLFDPRPRFQVWADFPSMYSACSVVKILRFESTAASRP
jgi:hypothetical protein